MKYKQTIKQYEQYGRKGYIFSIDTGNVNCYYGKYKYEVMIRGLFSFWKRSTYWYLLGTYIFSIKNWYLKKVR